MSARRIVVVGGGAVGLSVAWRCALLGADVVVVDERLDGGASPAAAGMLAPVTEVHYGEEALLRLNLAAAEAYGEFMGQLQSSTDMDSGYRRTGTLMVARDTDDNAALEDVFEFQKELDLDVSRLKSSECRALEPVLAPTVRGGILVSGDHQVDNRALVAALEIACGRAGVSFVASLATSITGGERVEGVAVADGSHIDASEVVLATGAWSNSLGGLATDALPPVRPVKGQLIHLRSPSGDGLPRHVIRGLDVYIVPRSDGRLVVGATVEEQGYDTKITAGAVMDLLRAAYELLPGLTEFELTEVACGLRPVAADNQPLLGPTDIPGLSVATGHFRNGILLAPITGELLARFLIDGEVPDLMKPFLPSRMRRAAS